MKTAITFIIEPTDVESAYRGAADRCSCGCAGNYYEQGDKGLKSVVNKINQNMSQVEIYQGTGTQVIFDFEYGNARCVRAYVQTDKLDSFVAKQLLEMAK